jgi:hypothetical protein
MSVEHDTITIHVAIVALVGISQSQTYLIQNTKELVLRNILGMPTYYTRQPKMGESLSGNKLTKEQVNILLKRSLERSKKRMKIINKQTKGNDNA